MRFAMGSRPGRFRLPGFGNFLQVGGYYWDIGGGRMAKYNDLLAAKYGTTNLFEAMKLTDEQKVETAREALGKPQRFRPIIRKLWRNRLVWKIQETAYDLNFYRQFGRWPIKDWKAEVEKLAARNREAAAQAQDSIS